MSLGKLPYLDSRCDFCGKGRNGDVELITHAAIVICSECLALCNGKNASGGAARQDKVFAPEKSETIDLLLKIILLSALQSDAKLIFFEVEATNFRVRFFIEEYWVEMMSPPMKFSRAIPDRIRELSQPMFIPSTGVHTHAILIYIKNLVVPVECLFCDIGNAHQVIMLFRDIPGLVPGDTLGFTSDMIRFENDDA